jgi:hypothetical protein
MPGAHEAFAKIAKSAAADREEETPLFDHHYNREMGRKGSLVTGVFVLIIGGSFAHGQTPSPTHVVIPFLANATKPSALEFEGAECETNRTGTTLRCEFQQVFLTTSDRAPDTCLVTTNRYQKTFLKDANGLWISNDIPAGVCGVMDVVTLKDEGGVRWTMEMKKVVTRKNAAASCAAAEEPPETLSWRDLRRPLPCKFVQPGGLSR